MRIVYFGSPKFALPALGAINKSKHKVVAVISQPDKPKGRSLEVAPTLVKKFAIENQIKVFTPNDLNDKEFVDDYKSLSSDINVVVAYGKIIPTWLIDFPNYKTINAHASLLPKYRGAAPIERALMDGEKAIGMTIQYVVKELDAGDIALQDKVEVADNDNQGTLRDKLAELTADMLTKSLDLLEQKKLPRKKQDESLASYASKIEKEEQIIDFNKSAKDIVNKMRALTPRPGVYTMFRGKRLKLLTGEVDSLEGDSGKILKVEKNGIVVGAIDGSVKLNMVQLEGKRAMNAYELAQGQRIEEGSSINDDDS